MPPYLCRFCGHSLTMHTHGGHCQVLDCQCKGLEAPEEVPPPKPSTAAEQREAYLASIRESLRRPDSFAEVEDHVRAGWDAGYCAATRLRLDPSA